MKKVLIAAILMTLGFAVPAQAQSVMGTWLTASGVAQSPASYALPHTPP